MTTRQTINLLTEHGTPESQSSFLQKISLYKEIKKIITKKAGTSYYIKHFFFLKKQ